MAELEQEIVDVKLNVLNVLNSVPNTPVTNTRASNNQCLQNTPIPKTKSLEWVKGPPTPIKDGTLSPNQQALRLLSGFATGQDTMAGDGLQHLPSMSEDQSIADSLRELPWSTPSPIKKKKINGSANRNKKLKVAKKEPRKTHAKQLAKLNPRTKVPDSEICSENIIPGSPIFIPYIIKINKGKGKSSKGPILKNSINPADMAHQKQTLTKAEKEAIKARNK